jgi:hypothetical protein
LLEFSSPPVTPADLRAWPGYHAGNKRVGPGQISAGSIATRQDRQ